MSEDDPPPGDFDYGEKRDDGQYENYPTIDEGEFKQQPRYSYIHDEEEGGCGVRTRMSAKLGKSVARNPSHYTKTFCSGCGEHVPVDEVHWVLDGEDWEVSD